MSAPVVHWWRPDFAVDDYGPTVLAECGAAGPVPKLDDRGAPGWASGWMQAVTCPACLADMDPRPGWLPSGIPEAEREALRERILAARARLADLRMRREQNARALDDQTAARAARPDYWRGIDEGAEPESPGDEDAGA